MNNLYSIENSNEETKRLSGRSMFAHESTMHWIIEHHQPIVAYTLSLVVLLHSHQCAKSSCSVRLFRYAVFTYSAFTHTYDRLRTHLYIHIHTCNGLEWNVCLGGMGMCEYRLTSNDSFRSDRRHWHTVRDALIKMMVFFLYSTLLFYQSLGRYMHRFNSCE